MAFPQHSELLSNAGIRSLKKGAFGEPALGEFNIVRDLWGYENKDVFSVSK
jgi:hypothetical protein